MELEEKYYENEMFWNYDQKNEKTVSRVKKICSIIPSDARSLLDAGCGNGTLLNHLKESSFQFGRLIGADRSKTALGYVRTKKVRANIANLPFTSHSFDIVSAIEVIEHLPHSYYGKALAEICRVARKYVLIGVPNKQKLDDSLIRCPRCRSCFEPDYHMRSFDSKPMRDLLCEFGFKNILLEYHGVIKNYALIAWMRKVKRGRVNPFQFDILCPVCGDFVPRSTKRHRSGSVPIEPRRKKVIRELLKLVWPRRTKHTWLLSLFARM